MARVTITEAKSRLPELLRRMDEGERITITRRGEAIGELPRAEDETAPAAFARSGAWDARSVLAPLGDVD